ncbi:MAG TPA: hypothetical protein VG734_04495 [Lacunisphaera sp.]|nr:hypothetical protein [Lacunisphaera sp.]
MIRRRPTQIFSLAFLDCICCGFGAIILLFVLTVDKQDKDTMESKEKLRALAASYLASLAELQQRKGDLISGSNDAAKLVLDAKKIEENMKGLLDDLANKIQYEKQGHKALVADIDDLKKDIAARQKKPEITLKDVQPTPLGLPAASNYVAFIIDSSGSMRDANTERIWPIVLKKFEEVLDAYPQIEGMQFLDADGRFIMGNRNPEQQWLPDTPANRQAMKQAIHNYDVFSNSNPVPGIVRALRTLYQPTNEKMTMTIFILGDEFTGTADAVLKRLDELNPKDAEGKRKVVINAIAFPTAIRMGFSMGNTGVKMANLMREVTYQHGGAFIALREVESE